VNTQKYSGPEIGMMIGMGISLFGAVAILVLSIDKGVSLVMWGAGSAFLIVSAGRTAIAKLKDELRRLQSEEPPFPGTPT
jgi:hypothetical protein